MPITAQEHKTFIAHRKQAQQEYLADLNAMLRFDNTIASKDFYSATNIDELALYLDAGADANIVLDAGIRLQVLAYVELAFHYTITKSFINTALNYASQEIIEFVVRKQHDHPFDQSSIDLCCTRSINILSLFQLKFEKYIHTDNKLETITTTRFDELTPLQKAQLIVYCLRKKYDHNSPAETNVYAFINACLPGAELNNATDANAQPLHAAMQHNHPVFVRALLRAGASPTTIDPTSKTTPIVHSSDQAMHAFISEIKNLLTEGEQSGLTPDALESLKQSFQEQLNYALIIKPLPHSKYFTPDAFCFLRYSAVLSRNQKTLSTVRSWCY